MNRLEGIKVQASEPAKATGDCLFSLFTPTYNRAHLLPRALQSIEQQTCRDFEVLVIDDGSTDDTQAVVESWAAATGLSVHYVWQENAGKPAAHNEAIRRARGRFIVILDSDDVLTPEALEILQRQWQAIPSHEWEHFAGVEGLCADLQTGQIIGDCFPQSVMDSSYLETRYRLGIGGDKKNAMRTDVLRMYPFPLFPGERHLPESIVWNRIAKRYNFRYVNEIIQYVEYQPDGLSGRIRRLRYENPRGFRLAALETIELCADYCSRLELYRSAVRYGRYSLLAGVGLFTQWRDIPRKGLWLLALPEAILHWLKDLCRRRHG